MNTLIAFFAKHYRWVVFVALEVLCGALLLRFNSFHHRVWLSSASSVAGAVYECRSAVTSFFSMGVANAELTERNIVLEQHFSVLRGRVGADSSAVAVPLVDGVSARVVSNAVSGLDNLITINRGSADGVAADMGVVSGLGVVGVTYLVGSHYAVVLPVLNSRSRISCSIRGKGYFGYLHWDGGAPNIAYVDDVPRHATVAVGDYVETNGYSAVFPEGILVGRVINVYDSSDALSYRLEVQLTTDFSTLRDVFVITDRQFIEQASMMRAAQDSLRHI